MQFRKYKIIITRTDEEDVKQQKWEKFADSGNDKDDGPVYGYAYYDSKSYPETKVLEMESRDENLDLKAVVKAILGIQ